MDGKILRGRERYYPKFLKAEPSLSSPVAINLLLSSIDCPDCFVLLLLLNKLRKQ